MISYCASQVGNGLLCYAAVLKILTYYAQYYAHVETALLEYIHLYHKIFNMETVLLEYI